MVLLHEASVHLAGPASQLVIRAGLDLLAKGALASHKGTNLRMALGTLLETAVG